MAQPRNIRQDIQEWGEGLVRLVDGNEASWSIDLAFRGPQAWRHPDTIDPSETPFIAVEVGDSNEEHEISSRTEGNCDLVFHGCVKPDQARFPDKPAVEIAELAIANLIKAVALNAVTQNGDVVVLRRKVTKRRTYDGALCLFEIIFGCEVSGVLGD